MAASPLTVPARADAGRSTWCGDSASGWGSLPPRSPAACCSTPRGLPSSYLFAALVVGLAIALARPGESDAPQHVFRGAQAVAGVSLGAYLESDALRALASLWLPVALVSLATLGLSLLCGEVLARTTPLDPPTAALGMIAGGASGIVGMSGELGADDRLVAFMQYLRVLVVVLLTPVGIAVLFGSKHESGGAQVPSTGTFGDPLDWLLTAALAAGGALLGLRARITAGVLLVPMLLTGVLVLTGVLHDFAVPALLNQTAFSLIGLRVGLSFTVGTVKLLGAPDAPRARDDRVPAGGELRARGRLAATTPATLLDAYLATTPGGLYAVLAVAFGAGANTTFIVAVQTLRVIAMVLLAPLAVRLMLKRPRWTILVVHLRARERELERRVALGEQPLAGAERERIDEQVELVDQAVGEHRSHQPGAAADVEVAVELLLQAPDRRRVVRSDDLRVAPRRLGQRARDDVLRCVVEERRARVVLDRPRRPRRLEHLVRRAAEQDALGALRDLAEPQPHLGVEAELERP